jgi:hypothetical protein
MISNNARYRKSAKTKIHWFMRGAKRWAVDWFFPVAEDQRLERFPETSALKT